MGLFGTNMSDIVLYWMAFLFITVISVQNLPAGMLLNLMLYLKDLIEDLEKRDKN